MVSNKQLFHSVQMHNNALIGMLAPLTIKQIISNLLVHGGLS